jgi:hypothetical protein
MRALLLGALLAVAVPVNAQQSANPRVSPALADLVYGAYCAQEPEATEPAPETASGTINIVPGIPDFQFRQKIVPAEVGIGFGVLAYAPPGVLMDPVTAIVTHPPYPDSGITTERWVTDIDDGPNLMGFSFDTASELVLGEWTFSAVTPEGEELFFISFEVVAPELMPQVISACFGSFTS